jgi:hypothetical protein
MKLSDFQIGQTRLEVEAKFGQPNDWSIGSNLDRRKYLKPAVCVYDNVEIGYDRTGGRTGDEDKVFYIYYVDQGFMDILQKCNIGEKCKIIFDAIPENTENARLLRSDLAAIELPDKNMIDIGWYPPFEINGEFRVTVYCGSWENQLENYSISSVEKLIECINGIVDRY